MEREVLVLPGFAVKADKGAFLTEDGSKLVHNTTLHAAVIVLRALAYLGQLEFLYLVVVEQIVDGEGEGALQGSRRTEAGAKGNVSGEDGVEAFHLAAALDGFTAYAKHVAGPGFLGFVLFLEAELRHLVKVKGVNLHLVRSVGLDGGHDAEVDGPGEHVTTVVVRVLANQVDAAGRCIKNTFLSKEGFEFFLDFGFHIRCFFMCVLQR